VETGIEAAQFLSWEYINPNLFAVYVDQAPQLFNNAVVYRHLECFLLLISGENWCSDSGENWCSDSGENWCSDSGENWCSDSGENWCSDSGENWCSDSGEMSEGDIQSRRRGVRQSTIYFMSSYL
jgi:hypothetical protein